MCRMCLVEIDSGRGPQLQPSCMVTVAPDMKVETESPASKRAQEGIIELLLANHPLDCPVCDKGGECPLQDQSFSHGPGESRYVEEKRHYEKPIPISDLVLLDRERCILCDRCTRFADEVAGDALIHFTQRGNETQVMTFPDEPFSSYFSGNTVQICPVGALTATPYRFKSRPWDLAESESTCIGCSVGCRITVQSSRDELVRYLGVDSDAVNWGWLCDKGRFGFEAVNSDGPRSPRRSCATDAGLAETSWNARARRRRPRCSPTRAGRPASPSSAAPAGTNEDAYAWAQLADAIGIRHRDAQLGDGLPASRARPAPGDDRRDGGGADHRPARAGPEGGARRPLPAAAPRGEQPHVAAHRADARRPPASPATRGAASASSRAAPPPRPPRSAPTTSGPSSAKGPVVIVAGRANLAESRPVGRVPRCAPCTRRSPPSSPTSRSCRRLRRGNVVGALQLGLRPRPGGDDALGHPDAAATARSTCSCCSAPTRCRTAPTPCWPATPSPAPRRWSRSTRSSPTRRRSPTSCCRPPRSPRRTARPPTSRAGSPR